jgi:hypothetical protein
MDLQTQPKTFFSFKNEKADGGPIRFSALRYAIVFERSAFARELFRMIF